MIPDAREVRLKPKVRKVLEARCRAPTTAQRDVNRTVLGRASSRSTARRRRCAFWRCWKRVAIEGACITGHGGFNDALIAFGLIARHVQCADPARWPQRLRRA